MDGNKQFLLGIFPDSTSSDSKVPIRYEAQNGIFGSGLFYHYFFDDKISYSTCPWSQSGMKSQKKIFKISNESKVTIPIYDFCVGFGIVKGTRSFFKF